VALIGNAAQTLHPVAAQGLNLGIRDACGLARALATASDPGSAEALRAYAHGRRGDSRAVIGFTHGLVYLFENHHPLARQARALGMNLLDILPPLRKRLAGHLVFGLGASA
jgi:2-octaprenyl-6-methoxyphenol hydroxylase